MYESNVSDQQPAPQLQKQIARGIYSLSKKERLAHVGKSSHGNSVLLALRHHSVLPPRKDMNLQVTSLRDCSRSWLLERPLQELLLRVPR